MHNVIVHIQYTEIVIDIVCEHYAFTLNTGNCGTAHT